MALNVQYFGNTSWCLDCLVPFSWYWEDFWLVDNIKNDHNQKSFIQYLFSGLAITMIPLYEKYNIVLYAPFYIKLYNVKKKHMKM